MQELSLQPSSSFSVIFLQQRVYQEVVTSQYQRRSKLFSPSKLRGSPSVSANQGNHCKRKADFTVANIKNCGARRKLKLPVKLGLNEEYQETGPMWTGLRVILYSKVKRKSWIGSTRANILVFSLMFSPPSFTMDDKLPLKSTMNKSNHDKHDDFDLRVQQMQDQI